MAIYTVNHTLAHTNGNPIQWAKDIHDGLISVGLTQTSDTGQMSMTSLPVANTSGGNALSYGYNIYQFTDSYQSTFPIYIKITWYNNIGGAYGRLGIQVGTGTNGSGTLTGKTTTAFSGDTAGSVLAMGTNVDSFISFSNGCLNIAVTPYQYQAGGTTALSYARHLYNISRLTNSSGTIVSGYFCEFAQGSTIATMNYIASDTKSTVGSFTGGSVGVSPCVVPYYWYTENPSLQIGTDIPYFPPTILDPNVKTVLGFQYITDASGANNNITIPRFGTNHTFKSLFQTTAKTPNGNARLGVAILWE